MTRHDAAAGLRSMMLALGLALAVPPMAQPVTRPALFPSPVSIRLEAGTVALGGKVVLVAAPGADPASVALVRRILLSAGVERIASASRLPATLKQTYIVVGTG